MLIRTKLIPTIEFLLQITWVLRKCNMHTNTHCAMVVDILWNRLGWVISLSLSLSLSDLLYVYAWMYEVRYEKDAKRKHWICAYLCSDASIELTITPTFLLFISILQFLECFSGIVFSSAYSLIFIRKEDPNCNFQFEFCMKFYQK